MSSCSVVTPFSEKFAFFVDPLEKYQKKSLVLPSLTARIKNCCHLIFQTNVGIVCAGSVLSMALTNVYWFAPGKEIFTSFSVVASAIAVSAYFHHCLLPTLLAIGMGVEANIIAKFTAELSREVSPIFGLITAGLGMGTVNGILSFIFGNVMASLQPIFAFEKKQETVIIGFLCQRLLALGTESIVGGVKGAMNGLFSSLFFFFLAVPISEMILQEKWKEECPERSFDQMEEEKATDAFINAIRVNYFKNQSDQKIEEEKEVLSVFTPDVIQKLAQIVIAELVINTTEPSESNTPSCFHVKISGTKSLLEEILDLRLLLQKRKTRAFLDQETAKLANRLISQSEEHLPGINLFRRALLSTA